MQTIQTKYIPATNFKESRIKVWNDDKSKTYSLPHEAHNAHLACAERFFREECQGWKAVQLLGGYVKGDGMVFVCQDTDLIISKTI